MWEKKIGEFFIVINICNERWTLVGTVKRSIKISDSHGAYCISWHSPRCTHLSSMTFAKVRSENLKKKWEKNPKDVHIVTMDSGVYDSSVYMFSLQINRPAQFLLRWDCWKHRGKYQSAAILRNMYKSYKLFLFSSDNCLIRTSGQGSDNDTHPKCNSAFGCYEPKTSFCL